LTFRDARTFVEEDSSHAASDFGGDRRAPSRGNVAAGIQESLSTASSDRFVHGSYFNERPLVPDRVDTPGNTPEDYQAAEENRETFAEFAALALPFVYTQRTEVVLCRTEWRGH
jgi:hypothetical protein